MNRAASTSRFAVTALVYSVISTFAAILFAGTASAHEEDFLPPVDGEAVTSAAPVETSGGVPMVLIAGGVVLVAVVASAVIVLKSRKSN
jgi:hypothetical protein